jgi:hypothetical protein
MGRTPNIDYFLEVERVRFRVLGFRNQVRHEASLVRRQ